MRRRVKKLLSLVLSCIICVQMLPVQTYAALTVDGNSYVVTASDLTDEYIIQNGGTLQFEEGLTVDGNVQFGAGYNYLVIPATTTFRGEFSGLNPGSVIQNSGGISSGVVLNEGTLENRGEVSGVVVTSGGMLKVFDGASFGELDMSSAGSGQVITEGTCSVETLKINPYGFSTVDSSSTQMNVSNAVSFTGTELLDEKIQICVSDMTAISTAGQTGLYVWKDGIRYALPDIPFGEKVLGDIYSMNIDKTVLSFEEQAIGYQTGDAATFEITNDGAFNCMVEFVPGGDWESMFTVTPSENVEAEESYFAIPVNETGSFEVALNPGLDAATHSGMLTVKCYTPDQDVFETFVISSDVTVAKKPSIPAPSGDFYTLSGTEGKNGYYTSDVTVTPMSGYQIAEHPDDIFSDSLTYRVTTKTPAVYLQKTATGQITEKATLETIKIDKKKPVISGCKASATYYSNEISITVTDDNLSSVKLNGDALAVTDNEASVTLTAGTDSAEYTIEAEDSAGNCKEITFCLAPAWREDGTVPGGTSIKLYKNRKYKFGSGTWKVDGDSTSYTGGNVFYVADDGNYTFTTSN